mmetsp:Transcript_24578/g.52964  ORF Transcript_24578/g.52964 Transcript_24578/m.52964 type:complete len:747 (-) Transcript_24578:1197-3437(-)
MQIKRKQGDQGSSSSKNGLRAAILVGGIALILLILSNVYEDDYYGSSSATHSRSSNVISDGASASSSSTMLRGESHDSDNRAEQLEQQQERRESSNDSKNTMNVKANDAPDEDKEQNKALPHESSPFSLLNSPDAIKSLPACQAIRHDLPPSGSDSDHGISVTSEFDDSHPAIFTGWSPPAIQKWGDRGQFRNSFGSHAQYVKGRDVRPLKDKEGNQCKTTTRFLIDTMVKLFHKNNPSFEDTSNNDVIDNKKSNDGMDLLFFTNNVENPSFLKALSSDYSIPTPLANLDPFSNDGFQVFSAMERGSSHPFNFHDAAWLGQVAGSRLWFFLPPNTPKGVVGPKVNGCDYLLGRAPLPTGTTACVQNAGEVVYFPSEWLHATCALEPWSVGIGGQGGNPNIYDQNFENLQPQTKEATVVEEQQKMVECGVLSEKDFESMPSSIATKGNDPLAEKPNADDEKDWKWYDGDLNEYYNKLERDEHAKRDPNKITSYAVHRWMGPKPNHSTLIHYELVRQAIYELVLGQYAPPSQSHSKLRVFDAGCGLGAGLMWFGEHEQNWELVGHTISDEQHKWIVEDLPKHNFEAKLRTYDEPLEDGNVLPFNAVYSIEAAVHSPDLKNSLKAWSEALLPGGVIIIIDDFLSVGVHRDDPDVDLFARSWIATSVHTTVEIASWADQMGMPLVRDRDLGSEFQIIKRNYRNKVPELTDENGRVHQGWLGSKIRQKLMVEGKISYRLIALQKKGTVKKK